MSLKQTTRNAQKLFLKIIIGCAGFVVLFLIIGILVYVSPSQEARESVGIPFTFAGVAFVLLCMMLCEWCYIQGCLVYMQEHETIPPAPFRINVFSFGGQKSTGPSKPS